MLSKSRPNYLVMEYIESTPLDGPLPVDQALKFAEQTCDALDAAHKKGIARRDLKPASQSRASSVGRCARRFVNTMVTAYGRTAHRPRRPDR